MIEFKSKHRMFIYGKGYVYLVPLPYGNKDVNVGEPLKIIFKDKVIEGKVRLYDRDNYCFAAALVGVFVSNDKCSECNEDADMKSSFYNLCNACKKALDKEWYDNCKPIKCFTVDRETGNLVHAETKAPNIRTWFEHKGFPRKPTKDETPIQVI